MRPDLRNQRNLEEQAGVAIKKRPLIGVPTGRERSQRFHGLPLYIMNQTYVRVLETMGALPVLIPLQMSEHVARHLRAVGWTLPARWRGHGPRHL